MTILLLILLKIFNIIQKSEINKDTVTFKNRKLENGQSLLISVIWCVCACVLVYVCVCVCVCV